MRGVIERLQRLSHRPLADDLNRLANFDVAVPAAFYERYPNHTDSAIWLHYASMVEEFRLSLFAPSLSLKGRASAKKLQSFATQLGLI